MNRTTLAAAAAALLSPALLAAPGATLKDVLGAFEKGEYPKVVELAGQVPAESEDAPRALYLAGEAQLVLGDAVAAERAFLGVLEARPEAVPALVGLARSLTAQDQLKEAELHLFAALELEEEDRAATRALGELQMRAGRLEEATKTLRAAYGMDEDDPRSVRALVELELRRGDTKAAAKLVKRFARKHRKHPLGPFLSGIVLEREGEDEEAIEAYQRALELDERYLDAHKNLAILGHTLSDTYRIQERNELAMKHYARYFELGGRDPELERTYAQLKGFLGQGAK